MKTMESERTYIPAAGHHWSLPLYDPFTKLIGVDRARKELLDQAGLRPYQRVLDVGCGTGTLAVLIKRLHPFVDVAGIDPDRKALARGRRKAEREGSAVQFDQGFSDRLPYPDGSFDRVFSSFMFHHLQRAEKEKTVREIHRVLKPGGRLEMVDFAGPEGGANSLVARVLHAHHLLKDNTETRILAFMTDAGLSDAKAMGHRAFFMGRIAYYQASR